MISGNIWKTGLFTAEIPHKIPKKQPISLFSSWRINFTRQTAPLGAGMGQVLEVGFCLDDF
jgi:hypothetical protein